jgi:hypothetical protein
MAVAGCTNAGAPGTAQGQRYRSNAGWSVRIPAGWHPVRFNESKDGVSAAGVQLSNVRLPRPSIVAGFPMQVNAGVLPSQGVGIVIATDHDPKLRRGTVVVPPLSSKEWLVGSSLGDQPYLETLWFRADGQVLLASAKIGAKAMPAALSAIDGIIRSVSE